MASKKPAHRRRRLCAFQRLRKIDRPSESGRGRLVNRTVPPARHRSAERLGPRGSRARADPGVRRSAPSFGHSGCRTSSTCRPSSWRISLPPRRKRRACSQTSTSPPRPRPPPAASPTSFPDVLAQEREAAIRQFMDAITVESARTRQLITELRGNAAGGHGDLELPHHHHPGIRCSWWHSSKSPRRPRGPRAPPGRPFDITEYTAAAAQIARASDQLQQLIAGIEHGTPGARAERGPCGGDAAGSHRSRLLAHRRADRAADRGGTRRGARLSRHRAALDRLKRPVVASCARSFST